MDWGQIFFLLHKHCHLDKWQIWEYTLPQVVELIKACNRYIQFEVQTRMTPWSIFGGGGGSQNHEDEDYHEATEEDIMMLAKVLGGG